MRGSRVATTCADPESSVRGGGATFFILFFYLFKTFFVDEGREDPNTTKSGSSAARQRNAIKIGIRWRADDGPTLNAGLVAV